MKITPQIFLTSDTHFGHTKMWAFWAHREEGFEEQIIKNWNKVVGPNDVVLHLGDLSLTNKEATKNWTNRLNGKKYLILGNHDSNSESWYRECGFEVIPNALKHFGQKDGSVMKVLFTHEPVMDLPDHWFNIHGHLHGDSHRGNVLYGPRYFDAGVDPNGLTPVRLYDILYKFKKPVDNPLYNLKK